MEKQLDLITYMRTDGTQISNEALQSCRSYIENEIGKNYLPEQPRNYSGKKAKNAQEAHEAIRPTDINRNPDFFKINIGSRSNAIIRTDLEQNSIFSNGICRI